MPGDREKGIGNDFERSYPEPTPEHCENQCHRKGKGSLTMQISQGLVDPN